MTAAPAAGTALETGGQRPTRNSSRKPIMIIPQKTIWLAVHGVFREHQVGIGGGLLLKDMMDGWIDCRLRQSDLANGLESLAALGFVRLEMADRGPAARLLDARFGMLQNTVTDRHAAEVLARVRELRTRALGAYSGGSGMPATGRRREDLLNAFANAA